MGILFWAHFLNGFLMIAMPIGLAIYLTHQFKLGWRLWWIGATTFVLAQVGHIPFNWAVGKLLNQTSMVNWPQTAQLIFNAVFGGLSAGLFEESFRYGMYRWWAKDARSWGKGLLAGAGHGGAEAILLGALVLYTFIQLAILRNADLSTLFSGDKLDLARQQIQVYWSASWYDSLMGAVERLFTIPVQVCLAVLVLQTFARKQWFWVWLAVLFHALTDATALLLSRYLSVYWTEAVIGGFAILSLTIIFTLRQPEPAPGPSTGSGQGLAPAPAPVAEFTPRPVEETEENLDKTRYQ